MSKDVLKDLCKFSPILNITPDGVNEMLEEVLDRFTYVDPQEVIFQNPPHSLKTDIFNKVPWNSKTTDKALVFEFEIPGVKKENIDIEIDERIFRVKFKARNGSDVSQGIKVPNADFVIEKMTAKAEDGLLTISIPKKEQEKKEAIRIKVE